MRLARGANTALTDPTCNVSLAWDAPGGVDADLTALLLGPDGKVRNDTDMVFYNQPASPDGHLRYAGKSSSGGTTAAVFTVDLGRLDPAVATVAFVLSTDGPTGTTCSDLTLPVLVVSDRTGATAAEYLIDGLVGTETALVTVELYRHAGAWKVRAVGQGYADGLAGLARDFGVDVTADPAGTADPAALPGPASVDWTNPPVPAGYEV